MGIGMNPPHYTVSVWGTKRRIFPPHGHELNDDTLAKLIEAAADGASYEDLQVLVNSDDSDDSDSDDLSLSFAPSFDEDE